MRKEAMKQVEVGRTGLKVSRLAFGTGYLEGAVSAGARLLVKAYDLGVNFWDTSDDYGTYPPTPGHLSLVVSSGAERAIILGDVMHCPVQFDEADWSVVFDVDQGLARRTRDRLMRELENPSTVSADGHFAAAVFGRVMPAQGKRQWRGIA